MKKDKKKPKTLEENLQNPIYVNYNLLFHLNNISTRLEEIKKIELASLELLRFFAGKILQQEQEEPEEPKKEEREGVFK